MGLFFIGAPCILNQLTWASVENMKLCKA